MQKVLSNGNGAQKVKAVYWYALNLLQNLACHSKSVLSNGTSTKTIKKELRAHCLVEVVGTAMAVRSVIATPLYCLLSLARTKKNCKPKVVCSFSSSFKPGATIGARMQLVAASARHAVCVCVCAYAAANRRNCTILRHQDPTQRTTRLTPDYLTKSTKALIKGT